jgi:hypothetical protein
MPWLFPPFKSPNLFPSNLIHSLTANATPTPPLLWLPLLSLVMFVDAQNFCTVWATYQSARRLNTGQICVCGGCWAQNSTPSAVDHLMADGAFPSRAPWSTRLQYSHRGLRWTNETNAADQNELIILLLPEHSAITKTVVMIHVEYITDLLTNK